VVDKRLVELYGVEFSRRSEVEGGTTMSQRSLCGLRVASAGGEATKCGRKNYCRFREEGGGRILEPGGGFSMVLLDCILISYLLLQCIQKGNDGEESFKYEELSQARSSHYRQIYVQCHTGTSKTFRAINESIH
jgi:hypothetical protein